MVWWLLASLAMAGNIHIDAHSPILVKLDGELVRKDPAARIVIDDLDPGNYRIEICNLVGNTVAFSDVSVDHDEEVFFKYEGKNLDRVQDYVTAVFGDMEEKFDPLLTDEAFRDLMRKVVKGSFTKKQAQVVKRTTGYSMEIRQVDDLLTAFGKREERLFIALMLRDQVRDPQNAARLDEHFGVESDRDKMREAYQ